MNSPFFAYYIFMKKNSIQQIVLPINLEIIIPEDDSVKLLYEVTEGLNYSRLYRTYSIIGRNPAIEPKTLFRILVYGYMEGIYSSRKLEKACRRDINFKWLLQGQLPPEHNTISRFRSSRISDCIEDLFSQMVLKLKEYNEIKFENLFVDGTKIEANANRYTFVWKKAVDKFEARLQEKMRTVLKSLKEDLRINYEISNDKILVSDITQIIENTIKPLIEKDSIRFVYGKGKRKSYLQRYTEQLENFIEKQQKYDGYNNLFEGRNSFSKTDIDATFMRMKEDHMKNGQLKPGYNVQIGVEGEYIVGCDVSSERSDQLTFIPFLERLQKNLGEKYENITADAGYESEENYLYLKNSSQNAYIKPQTYEKSKTAKFKKDISRRENMTYDKENDRYICAAGRLLVPAGTRTRKSKSGFLRNSTVYECMDCNLCECRDRCTKSKYNKRIEVPKNFIKLREESLKNITTPAGILLRMNRSIQVEGAFGVLKQDYGFRRFLMRGKKNIRIEVILMSFAYDINKLHNKTMQNRNGMLLHKQLA